ncbi:hypothetical protein [Paenibacillus spongiae]|uniref:Uncharacterized protein n=1 Tax=Paenibacillus spongiae TaxID=2909671 RepID=A0ABY5SBZ3_9BACL|nr:hypothetical protein [Paenibacillus spongiae]UVI31464.1 hypothetical protein L1F29_06480 [Paenibacillus spongiae]
MPELVNKRLLIKQVIGRLLLDTSVSGCPFILEQDGERWVVTVRNVAAHVGAEVKRLESDLNLFYFEEESGSDARKWWLFDRDQPEIEWDEAQHLLKLSLDSRVSYTNEKV